MVDRVTTAARGPALQCAKLCNQARMNQQLNCAWAQGRQDLAVQISREAGLRPSMGSVGDGYDNALCESFFATLECELIDRRRWPTQAEARTEVFAFIEGWYNPRRRHSSIDYLSPIDYERKHQSTPRCANP